MTQLDHCTSYQLHIKSVCCFIQLEAVLRKVRAHLDEHEDLSQRLSTISCILPFLGFVHIACFFCLYVLSGEVLY